MSFLQDISDDLTARLGAATGVSDLQFDTLAAGPHPLDVDWMRRDSLLGRVAPNTSRSYYAERGVVPSATAPVMTEEDLDRRIASRWIIPARWRAMTCGYVWVINDRDHPVSAEAIDAIAPLCDRIGEHLHRRTVRLRDHATSLQELLTSHRDGCHESATRLYEVGGYPVGAVAALVLNVVAEPGERAALPPDVLDGPFPRAVLGDVWRFVDGTRAVLLAPPSTVARDGAVRRVAEHARDVTQRETEGRATVVIGVGDAVSSLFEASRSFKQARLSARAAAALDTVPAIAEWQRLGAIRAVLSIPDEDLDDAIAPGVSRLCEEASFLAETVEVYFAAGGNVNEAADRLMVSRGTVYYRLQRAEAASGLSLKSGPDRMTLEVGLAIIRLRERTTRNLVRLSS